MARIAVIDDSGIMLAWAEAELPKHGFEVVTYSAPMGIQSFILTQKPDLVLLDVRMPALRGDTVCKLIKAKPAAKDVLVVLYSSLPSAELGVRARECGADGFIEKTKDVQLLASSIRSMLCGRGAK